jgi:photosynthetic reaction center H subunit
MRNVILVGGLDVAELAFYAFFIFFVGLVIYLRQQDRLEGYPKEDEKGRILSPAGPATMSRPRRFKLPFDRGTVVVPRRGAEPPFAARRVDRFDGAPYEPTGDPLVDGVGPAAWAERSRLPDLDMEGRLRIVPIGEEEHFSIAPRDPALIGWPVVAAGGEVAGTVTDVWIDRSDRLIRYLGVATNGGHEVLAPIMMANVDRRRRRVVINVISADQFTRAPVLETAGQITRYEEDRIQAYFGGGYLYGAPGRAEPFL